MRISDWSSDVCSSDLNNLLSLPSYIRSQTVSVAVSTTLPAGGAGGIGAVTAPGRNAGLVASGTSTSAISSSVGAVKNYVRHKPYPLANISASAPAVPASSRGGTSAA